MKDLHSMWVIFGHLWVPLQYLQDSRQGALFIGFEEYGASILMHILEHKNVQ